MYKVKIYVKNGFSWDDDVSIKIKIPLIPKIGDSLYLNYRMLRKLEKMATSKLEIAQRYAPDWFYGGSVNITHPTKENLNDLCFDDLLIVSDIGISANDKYIAIELKSY